jgi:hypothetical protein
MAMGEHRIGLPGPGPYPRADHPLMFQLSQHRLRAPMANVLQPAKCCHSIERRTKADRFGSARVAHKTLAVSRRLRCEDKKPDRYWSAPPACEKASARETITSSRYQQRSRCLVSDWFEPSLWCQNTEIGNLRPETDGPKCAKFGFDSPFAISGGLPRNC